MVTFKQTKDGRELDEAYKLLHDQYVAQQYIAPQPDGMLHPFPELDAQTTTFVAVEDNVVIGTLSFTIEGLLSLPLSSQSYEEQLKAIRKKGSLGLLWRLATKETCRNNLPIVLNLFNLFYKEAMEKQVYFCIQVVNPKHERFYTQIIGAEVMANGTCDWTQGAPGVLLFIDVKASENIWREFMKRRGIILGS